MKQEQGKAWQGCGQFFSSCAVQQCSRDFKSGKLWRRALVISCSSSSVLNNINGAMHSWTLIMWFFFLGEHNILKAVYCSQGENSSGNHLVSLHISSPCKLEQFQWQLSLLLFPWGSSSYCSGDLEDHLVYAVGNNAATLLLQAPCEPL